MLRVTCVLVVGAVVANPFCRLKTPETCAGNTLTLTSGVKDDARPNLFGDRCYVSSSYRDTADGSIWFIGNERMSPFLYDWDGDGDADMLVGDGEQGRVLYFENVDGKGTMVEQGCSDSWGSSGYYSGVFLCLPHPPTLRPCG